MSDDPWADVFEMAIGAGQSSTTSHDVVVHTGTCSSINGKGRQVPSSEQTTITTSTNVPTNPESIHRNTKKKKRKLSFNSIDNNGIFLEYLRKRIDSTPSYDDDIYNTYYKHMNSMVANIPCRQFCYYQSTTPTSSSSVLQCHNCHLSRTEHIREPKVSNPHWSVQLLCCIYNLRYCSKLCATTNQRLCTVTSTNTDSATTNNNIHRTILGDEAVDNCRRKEPRSRTIQDQVRKLQNLTEANHNLPDSIVSTCKELIRHTQDLLQKFYQLKKYDGSNKDNSTNKVAPTKILQLFEKAVRTIIACDNVYYNLYYIQITDPIRWLNNCFVVPHPVTYFGEGLGSCISVPHDMQQQQSANNKDDNDETYIRSTCTNALEELHKYRRIETIELFYNTGWYLLPSTIQQIKEQFRTVSTTISLSTNNNNNIKRKHNENSSDSDSVDWYMKQFETIAPPLLMEWRDSCRDYLCHLYSYATLSNSTIQTLCHTLRQPQQQQQSQTIDHIIEIGAGTGYLSFLLETIGRIPVTPYDSIPTTYWNDSSVTNNNTSISTTTMNEYHGSTPSFVHVQRKEVGCTTTTKKKKQQHHGYRDYKNPDHDSIFNSSTIHTSALLLCYPPPCNLMAYNTVKEYVNAGGKIIIHIGEMKGLTGSYELEEYFLSHCTLLKRLECLLWGTDSSEITIWVTKTTTTTTVLPMAVTERTNKQQSINTNNINNQHHHHDHRQQQLLVPCSGCQQKEATKQLRLFRTINYCTKHCFYRHQKEREILLLQNQMIMIRTTTDNDDDDNTTILQLDFDNEHHFNKLR